MSSGFWTLLNWKTLLIFRIQHMNSKKLRTRGTPSTENEQGEICCVERFPGATWALTWKICGRQERCVSKKVWETSNVMPHLGPMLPFLIEKEIPMLVESQRKKDLWVRSHVNCKKLTSKAYPFPNDVNKIRHQECILEEIVRHPGPSLSHHFFWGFFPQTNQPTVPFRSPSWGNCMSVVPRSWRWRERL